MKNQKKEVTCATSQSVFTRKKFNLPNTFTVGEPVIEEIHRFFMDPSQSQHCYTTIAWPPHGINYDMYCRRNRSAMALAQILESPHFDVSIRILVCSSAPHHNLNSRLYRWDKFYNNPIILGGLEDATWIEDHDAGNHPENTDEDPPSIYLWMEMLRIQQEQKQLASAGYEVFEAETMGYGGVEIPIPSIFGLVLTRRHSP